MASIIHLKENDTLQKQLEFLMNTLYEGMGKSEIIRQLVAEKVWNLKLVTNQAQSSLFKIYSPVEYNKQLHEARQFGQKALKAYDMDENASEQDIQKFLKSI